MVRTGRGRKAKGHGLNMMASLLFSSRKSSPQQSHQGQVSSESLHCIPEVIAIMFLALHVVTTEEHRICIPDSMGQDGRKACVLSAEVF